METNKEQQLPTVIEIIDSSDDSDNESTNIDQRHLAPILSRIAELSTPDGSTSNSDTPDIIPDLPNSNDSSTSKDVPKKIRNRRKTFHQPIKAMENLSFEITSQKTPDNEVSVIPPKKKRWDESNIDEAIDDNIEDPQVMRMLRKIAYCRVFTNYLLRQYDMLAIEFKLYSNVDLLMLQLNKRMDTYSAIRRSRMQLLMNAENNGDVV